MKKIKIFIGITFITLCISAAMMNVSLAPNFDENKWLTMSNIEVLSLSEGGYGGCTSSGSIPCPDGTWAFGKYE